MTEVAAPPSTRRFVILREIGAGGSGRVWLAMDRYTGQGPLALKVFPAGGAKGEAVRALEEEFFALRELSHPGLVKVFERGVIPDTGEAWYTSEFIDGEDLVAASSGASPEDVLEFTIQLLRTLGTIHRRGWVHLDLKPGNVLVTREGRTKILDFGLACREGKPTREGRIRGTLPYVAPETLDVGVIDRRADLYSLGVLLYQALTGSLPERGQSLLPGFSKEDLLALPEPFSRIVPELVEEDPGRRPASAEQVLSLLSEATGDEIPVETEETLRANLAGGWLVGREVELGTLMNALRTVVKERCDAGDRRIVLLQGEAGIGKKRLLSEFRDRCQREGVDFFSASCYEGEEGTWAPLEPVLRALLARVGEDSTRARRALPALARILTDLPDEASRATEEPDTEDRLAWYEELVQFIRSAARGGEGYVLAVQDVHRGSFELIDFLGYLCRSLCLSAEFCPPILIVFSARATPDMPETLLEVLAELSAEELILPIRLGRLPESSVREYLVSTLGPPDPPRRLVSVLHEKSGGNPFLLDQLLKSLVEDGTVRYEGGRLRVADLARVRTPETIEQMVEARLAELTGEERETLETVAAFGEPVAVRILSKVVPGAGPAVKALLQRQILVEPEGEGVVTFRHTLHAQTVLKRAGPARLRAIHSRLGRALEDLGGSGVFRPEKIAHHVSLGEERGKALRYSLGMAHRLSERGQHDPAAIFTMRALARLEREDPRRPELLEQLGDSHAAAGRPDLAASSYRKALDEWEDPASVVNVHRKLAETLERTGAWEEARDQVRAGLARLDPEDLGARIPMLRLLGTIQKQLGEYEAAIEAIREGLRLARGEPSEETASLLNLLGILHLERGDHRKSLSFHLRALRFSESIEFEAGQAAALLNLGTLMSAWEEVERALDYDSRALLISEKLGNLSAVALLYNNIGNLHSERGDFERAEYYHRRSLGIRRRIADPHGVAMSFGNIGSMHRLRGQWGLARIYYERSIRHFDRIGNHYGAAFFRTHEADLLLLVGALDHAEARLRAADSEASGHALRRIEARVNLLTGRLLRLRGDFDSARKRLTRAIEIDRQVANREGVVNAQLELALLQRDRGRRGQAFRAVARALIEVKEARSESAFARCRYIRASLAVTGHEEEVAEDVRAWIEFAERVNRPDARMEGLSLRAARAFAAGDVEGAAGDLGEALRLSEGLADALPGELARIYREDPRRGELRRLAERVRGELEKGEGDGTLPAAFPGSDRMKPDTLVRLLEINKRLNSETDLHALLEFIMDTAVEITGAERGFLILVEEGRIAFQSARNFKRKEVEEPELKISQNIVRHVMKTGETLLTDNATEDERFAKFRSVDDLKLTSILSVPFRSRSRQIGALYLDNQARKGVFSQEDAETLSALSDQAAIAIQNLQSKQKLTEQLQAQDSELKRYRQALEERPYKHDYDEIIGAAPRMREVFLLLDKIIDTEVPVLIQGESGTGKELVARAVHVKGPREKGPFVPVNCGAVPDTLLESEFFGYVRGAFTGANSDRKGYFEQAHHGTLFLDEIGDMDFDMQKKLLRVLQQGEVRPVGGKNTVQVDVRIVCATNRDLRQLMLEHKFREDLFYRINVLAVDLPALRERREDIPLLVEHFAQKTAKEMGMEPKPVDQEAMALLTAYDWPGNVRELENEVKKATALSGEEIVADDLSPHIQGDRGGEEPSLVPSKGTLKETMEATEKSVIVRALEETGGNQTQAAKNLGISRVWLRKKMEKYGLLD